MKSQKVLDLVNSININEATFAVGDMVAFKKGHELEGVVGLVQNLEKNGTIDLRVGAAIRVGVKASDLVKFSKTHPGVGA